MLDIKFIRENADLIKEAARKKHSSFVVEDLVAIDQKRLEILKKVEDLRATQNEASEKIMKASLLERQDLIIKMKEVKDTLKKDEEELEEVMKKWRITIAVFPLSSPAQSDVIRRSARRQVVLATSRLAESSVSPGVAHPLKETFCASISATHRSSRSVKLS